MASQSPPVTTSTTWSSPPSSSPSLSPHQRWLIYPRKCFLPVRTIQILLSFIFILINSVPTTPGLQPLEASVFFLPAHCIAFIFYTATFIAYIHNPTRLSRVVVDLKTNPYPRKALLPLPNKDNLSRKGATLTIVIIEFLVALTFLGAFIPVTMYASMIGSEDGPCLYVKWEMDSSSTFSPIVDHKARAKCARWLWSNDIIGCLGFSILGFVMFVWGFRVYRAGWRESCRRELERELLEEMRSARVDGKVGLRDSGVGEADVELGDLAGK